MRSVLGGSGVLVAMIAVICMSASGAAAARARHRLRQPVPESERLMGPFARSRAPASRLAGDPPAAMP
jgi:hypothetical protein